MVSLRPPLPRIRVPHPVRVRPRFDHAGVGEEADGSGFRPDPTAPARELLHRIYYAQKEYHKKYGRWAATLREPGLDGAAELRITPDGFEAATGGLRIRQDALILSDP
ncbi:MAG: hypothetical protein HY238_27990 [Acidobacteria bacterium]|nr:hypothetical protein [Acidobacteriota bacterium]